MYAPTSTNINTIMAKVEGKIADGQAVRVVIDMRANPLTPDQYADLANRLAGKGIGKDSNNHCPTTPQMNEGLSLCPNSYVNAVKHCL